MGDSQTSRILVVEDEPELRALIGEELEAAGFDVHVVADGIDALAELDKWRPDVVLSDVCMPRLDGFGLLRAVRDRNGATAQTPFVFLSALAERSHVLEGLGAGAEDYLTKPIDFDLLLAKLKARTDQARRARAAHDRELLRLYDALQAARGETANAAAGTSAPKAQGGAARPRTPDAAPSSKPEAQATERIRNAVRRDEPVVTGRFQLVSLARIRKELGGRWDELADRMFQTVERVLAARLGPEDTYARTDTNDYLVLFSDLAPTEAQFKADQLAREIEERLIGVAGRGDVRVNIDDLAVTGDAAAVKVDPETIDEPSTVFERLSQALEDTLGADDNKVQAWLNSLAETASLGLISVFDEYGIPGRLRFARLDDKTDAHRRRLERRGCIDEHREVQIDATVLFKFLEAHDNDWLDPEIVYALRVSRRLLNVRRHFAIAERIFSHGLQGISKRLLLRLDASVHHYATLEMPLQTLSRRVAGISIMVDDVSCAEAALGDARVRVLEISTKALTAWGEEALPAVGNLVRHATERRKLVVATDARSLEQLSLPPLDDLGIRHFACP